MRRKVSACCALIVGGAMVVPVAFAGSPVGTATSNGLFRVSDTTTKMAGIPSWPLVLGDVVEAGDMVTMIMLNDRARFILQPGARVSVEGEDDQVNVRLLDGVMDYVLPPRARSQVFVGTQALTESQGQVAVGQAGPSYVPPRARGPITTNAPPGLRPRSPNSPCAADKTAPPPRSPCNQGRGSTP